MMPTFIIKVVRLWKNFSYVNISEIEEILILVSQQEAVM